MRVMRPLWRVPASAAQWMRAPAPGASRPGDFRWQRALAYRGASSDPQRAGHWRAQFDALAQRSLQKFQRSVPGAAKLATPDSRAALQSILRDLQNARVSLNDRQVRAKAAELRVIVEYLRRPDVASVRVIPSSSAGRTPDLFVTYQPDRFGRRRPSERVEVRTLTGVGLGWRRSAGVPGRQSPAAESLMRAIDAKLRRGQLTAMAPATRGLPAGGTIALHMTAPAAQADTMARQAMQALAARLAGRPELRRIEIFTGGRLLRFDRQADGRYVEAMPARAPAGGATEVRRRAAAPRGRPRRRTRR